MTGWPGQRISVDMQAIDELNFSTSGIVELVPDNSISPVSHREDYVVLELLYCL